MPIDSEVARDRVARLARQLLRQERRAALLEVHGGAEREQSLLASSRRLTLDALAQHAHELEDPRVRSLCSLLLGLYEALERQRDQETLEDVFDALAELVEALPPPSVIGRLRPAARSA